MKTPREIVEDILRHLGVDDASNAEKARLAKLVYSVQNKAFRAACGGLPEDRIREMWFRAVRQYGLGGRQVYER